MPSVNKATIVGHLGKDPELTTTSTGKQVCKFSVATSEHWKNSDGQAQEATTWHNIVAWGKPAEVLAAYLHKGDPVYIEGRIDNRSYDDKDGNKRYVSEIIVKEFQLLKQRERTDSQQLTQQKGDNPASDDGLPF